MANQPRKFSEKIALHNHRQAEETAAFEKIMREVSDVTTRVLPAKNTLRINTQALGAFRGGSLPNVSAGKASSQNSDSSQKPSEEPPRQQVTNYRTGSRERSPGGPMRRPHDRKLDTSPYSSGAYLSPPSDTGWRRTNSDSALHQSAMQVLNMDRNDSSNRGPWSMAAAMNGPDRNSGRPRSSCDIPRVHIHPSAHEPGMIQIPIHGNNTGSLPDLTNVDFTSPIHAPLDADQDSSPYSSSPLNTSPSTLSPTSIPQAVRSQGHFHFSQVSPTHPNHLSVPGNNSRYHHRHYRQSVPIDKNIRALDGTDFTQLGNITGMYQQQCPPTSPSPTLQQAAGYRSPRPSPQLSPSLDGRHSAPCSPGVPSPLSNDYQTFQHQFQQNFEALSMLDNPPDSSPISYVDQSAQSPQMTQSHTQSLSEVTSLGSIEMPSDAGYYSTSPSQQLVYPSPSPGLQNTAPNTPTITLTDFSDSRQDLQRQFTSDLFDEQLKDSLGTLDFEDIQILNSTVAGPSITEIIEENFRS